MRYAPYPPPCLHRVRESSDHTCPLVCTVVLLCFSFGVCPGYVLAFVGEESFPEYGCCFVLRRFYIKLGGVWGAFGMLWVA